MNQLVCVNRAFFCDSPFQIFTSIHIVLHDRMESDIYVLDSFMEAKEVVEKLTQTGVFRKAILIQSESLYNKNKSVKKAALSSSINTFKTYFKVDEIVLKYLDHVEYRYMYFTCNQLAFRLARFYCIKHNYMTEFVLFDEGAGSYDGHFEKVKLSDKIVRTILFGKRSDNQGLKLYLYQPELYYDYQNRKKDIVRIPKVDEIDYNNASIYRDVFNSKETPTNKKCIFIDTLREEVCDSEYAFSMLNKWFDTVETEIGYERMTIKSHPRAYGRYPHRCEEYSSRSPIEIDYLSMNLDNMCLISLLSTAVISPKILLDQEPYVILFCDVDERVYRPKKELLDYYFSIKALYRNSERFMIPKNYEEFKNCLKYVAERL